MEIASDVGGDGDFRLCRHHHCTHTLVPKVIFMYVSSYDEDVRNAYKQTNRSPEYNYSPGQS